MPRTTLYGPYNIPVHGEYQYSPTEADPYDVQQALLSLQSVWSYPEFWLGNAQIPALSRFSTWSAFRTDRPSLFIGNQASGLYTPASPAYIDFNADYDDYPASFPLAAHEAGGHRFQHVYNAWGTDDAAQMFQDYCKRGGATTMEQVATAVGNVLLKRLGLAVTPIPDLDRVMESLRVARLT